MRIVVVIDWDSEAGMAVAETIAPLYTNGTIVTATSPTRALLALADEWTAQTEHQAILLTQGSG